MLTNWGKVCKVECCHPLHIDITVHQIYLWDRWRWHPLFSDKESMGWVVSVVFVQTFLTLLHGLLLPLRVGKSINFHRRVYLSVVFSCLGVFIMHRDERKTFSCIWIILASQIRVSYHPKVLWTATGQTKNCKLSASASRILSIPHFWILPIFLLVFYMATPCRTAESVSVGQ